MQSDRPLALLHDCRYIEVAPVAFRGAGQASAGVSLCGHATMSWRLAVTIGTPSLCCALRTFHGFITRWSRSGQCRMGFLALLTLDHMYGSHPSLPMAIR